MSSEEYNKHTVVELKAMLTEKGLPVTGKKAELVDRLVEAETGVPQIPGVTITRPSDKRAEAQESAAPATKEPISKTTVTSIPNEDNKTTEVDLNANEPLVPTTLVQLGVGAEKTPAEIELEKRRARAAKFGVPFIEPTTTTQNAPPSSKKANEKKPPASEASSSAIVPTPSAASTAESEEALARRRAKWGVVEKPGAMQKVKGKLVEKSEAVKAAVTGDKAAEPTKSEVAPAEKTAEQIEEERRRKAREDRFKSSTETVADGEEQNGAEKRKLDDFVEPANTTEEPLEKKVKV